MKFLAKNYFAFAFVVILILHFILDKGLGVENSWIRFGVTTLVLILLMPRRKKIKTPQGEKIQITWIFLKEPIILE